jgi:phospholipid/cholesterol/gamma-HCH transport system ATP-binding protein
VLYDEPTAGLDPITKRSIVELMIKLRDMEGVTSIFVTHDLNAASTIASEYAMADKDGNVTFQPAAEAADLLNTRFIMLQNGSICFEGDYQEMMHSTMPYVRAFTS